MATSSHSPKLEKASWDEMNTGIFLTLLVEEIDAGNRPAGHFTRLAWTNITTKFFTTSGCNFTQTQLKNKWDNMKKEFGLWEKLLHEETGLGYDHTTGRITADPHWWRQKIKEKSEYRKFKTQGPMHLHLQERVFRGIVATGEFEYRPSNWFKTQTPPVPLKVEHAQNDAADFISGDSPNVVPSGNQDFTDVEAPFVNQGSSSKKPLKRKRNRTNSTRQNIQCSKEDMADLISVMKKTEETAQSVLAAETMGAGSYAEIVTLCHGLKWMDDEILMLALTVLEDNTKRIAFLGLLDKSEAFLRRWIHVQASVMNLSQKFNL